MTLKEQVIVVEDQVRKTLIMALEEKDYHKSKKLFDILNDVRSLFPYKYEPLKESYDTMNNFSISSSPDIISFGGTATSVSDRH